MELLEELVQKLETEEFSLKLISWCTIMFNSGEMDNNDFKKFSEVFRKKAKENCPVLTDEQIEQILNAIYWGGGNGLEDVLFLDGGAFAITKHENSWCDDAPIDYGVYFHGPSGEYKGTDFLDTTHFFYYHLAISKKLNESVMEILPQLRDEINDIFVNYYNNHDFPEQLGTDSAFSHFYAISYNEDEIINGLNNKTPFNVSIMCRVENECRVIKLDINCNLSNEKFLTVTSVNENAKRLSDIIIQCRHDKLIDFLVKAKKQTYANGSAKKVKSSRLNSSDYEYTDGKMTYHDTYFGGTDFIGEEVVYDERQIPIWAMNYYGVTLNDDLGEEAVDDALRPALMKVGEDDVLPLRGPKEFVNGEYKYTFEVTGDLDKFKGEESIVRGNEKVYSLLCHGGKIRR